MSSFHRRDLRQSMEWAADEWVDIKSRSDLVGSVLSLMKEKEVEVKHDEKLSGAGDGDGVVSPNGEAKPTVSLSVATTNKSSTKQPVPDLLKDVLVFDLNWEPSKKRKRSASYGRHKPSAAEGLSRERSLDCQKCSSMGDSLFSSPVVSRRKRNRIVSYCPHKPSLTDGFSCEKPLDCENGKFMGDSVFGSSVGQSLTGLVMSR
ncbi:unnamed protein product [Eruca vesicaria subsp. sativa]|uniref:Uncharacterized protein n=1 Tax=Eruca vesicaria subsp. sativa TaxID=29727 RepID=A0ABC8KSZ6_ERUVS|nr:unnamed protein product [Eruca vesicaria subsp. sativa]